MSRWILSPTCGAARAGSGSRSRWRKTARLPSPIRATASARFTSRGNNRFPTCRNRLKADGGSGVRGLLERGDQLMRLDGVGEAGVEGFALLHGAGQTQIGLGYVARRAGGDGVRYQGEARGRVHGRQRLLATRAEKLVGSVIDAGIAIAAVGAYADRQSAFPAIDFERPAA